MPFDPSALAPGLAAGVSAGSRKLHDLFGGMKSAKRKKLRKPKKKRKAAGGIFNAVPSLNNAAEAADAIYGRVGYKKKNRKAVGRTVGRVGNRTRVRGR
tara:strand:+ start:2613 stop:2909 length:297 start_codon:yes stop_codon:yes gene_type:complete